MPRMKKKMGRQNDLRGHLVDFPSRLVPSATLFHLLLLLFPFLALVLVYFTLLSRPQEHLALMMRCNLHPQILNCLAI